MSYSKVVLANLGNGALDERFLVELAKVVKNIEDLNTDAKAERSITMTVKFKPDPERESVNVLLKCSSKLAPPTVKETVIHLAMDPATGKTSAFAADFKQAGLFDPQDAIAASVEASKVTE